LPFGYGIIKAPVLGGLHHDYRLEKEVASRGLAEIIQDHNLSPASIATMKSNTKLPLYHR
jgi:hypothetical protein